MMKIILIISALLFVDCFAQVNAPEFSVKHGFYQASFDLIISAAESSSKIRYTLDGSDPRTSWTSVEQFSYSVIRIDPESSEGQRSKSPGVVVRACTISHDTLISEVVTQSYLFANKAAALSPHGSKPGTGWPNPTTSASSQSIDYGMDPDVLNDIRYKDVIEDALISIPTISLVTDLKNLFDPYKGIYMNAGQDGADWERPASIELIKPDGSEGFQINAGVRIRGSASRSGSNPKHAFRFFFRKEYGKGKLKYPLFENEGVDEFDKVDLRTSQNYSWSFPGHQGEYNTMNRDVFSRDLQRETGQPYTRSRFYHLYINGVYWGIYQTQERPEAKFAASYFGGSDEEYDVIKPGDSAWPSVIEATDGNMDAYREVWDLCVSGFNNNVNYYKLQGLNEDGKRNSSYTVLVDINNLIDYMLVIFYAGNFDAPITIWSNNSSPRNFYCIYNRNGQEGFKFFVHDAEHTLRTTPGEHPATIGLYENRVNLGTLTNSYKMVVNTFSNFHPQWLHFKLSENPEYRIQFADHVYKHFFNYGCMTPDKVIQLFLSRAKEIQTAIVAESARWGDTYYQPARTKHDHWKKAVDDIVFNYFPYRTDIVLNQLKDAGLYPKISPPLFLSSNRIVFSDSVKAEPGYLLKIQKQSQDPGIIKYTLDGNDPRLSGGAPSNTTLDGSNAVVVLINSTQKIKARILNGDEWSALHELLIEIKESTTYADKEELPAVFELSQNYPNPFNGQTKIQYCIKSAGRVQLSVYDILGNGIMHPDDSFKNPGNYTYYFNSENLSSGIYFYRLQSPDGVITKKMILLR